MIIFRNKNNCYWLVNYRTYLITHIFTYDLCAFKISEWFHLWLWPLVFGSWLGANTVVQHSCLVSRSQLRIVMGPLSDMVGRRAGLILCSIITLVGALLSTFAWGENALIAARREQKWKTKTTWDVLWDFAPFHNRCCTSKFWPTSTPRALLKIVKCWVLEHCGHTRGWRCSCISIGFCSVPTKNIARIITGVGMGGEYPLASSHSAESSEGLGRWSSQRGSVIPLWLRGWPGIVPLGDLLDGCVWRAPASSVAMDLCGGIHPASRAADSSTIVVEIGHYSGRKLW